LIRVYVGGLIGTALGIPVVLALQPVPLLAIVSGSIAMIAGMVAGAMTI
jgi:hypothetical protein